MSSETITIDKKQLQDLMSTVETLRKEVKTLKDNQDRTTHTTSKARPVFHSLSAIRSGQANREAEKMERVDEMLSKATEYVIKDFKQNPPKRY